MTIFDYYMLFLCIFTSFIAACGPKFTGGGAAGGNATKCTPVIDTSLIRVVDTDGSDSRLTAFTTQEGDELIGCLPNTYFTATPYTQLPVYSIRFENLHRGDVLTVLAEFEVTNDTGLTFMIASLLSASSNPTTIGTYLDQANGFNVTAAMHHAQTVKTAVYVVPSDVVVLYVTLFAWTSSDAIDGGFLKVEREYGRIQGFIYREETK